MGLGNELVSVRECTVQNGFSEGHGGSVERTVVTKNVTDIIAKNQDEKSPAQFYGGRKNQLLLRIL